MNHYFTFDRINNERILSFYSRKPLDFGGAALEAEGRRKLIESIEADFGYKFRAVKQCTKQVHGDRVRTAFSQTLRESRWKSTRRTARAFSSMIRCGT